MRLRIVIIGVGLLGLAVATAAMLRSDFAWRLEVLWMKATGDFEEVAWSELVRMVDPRGPYKAGQLVRTGNAFASIRNPYAGPRDRAAGAEAFRRHCELCHGSGGHGAGPDFSDHVPQHGLSDWALYRNISRGISDTSMPGWPQLGERATWQLVSHIRFLQQQRAGAVPEPTPAEAVSVPYETLQAAEQTPADWLTYSGGYASHRHSRLAQIDRSNVASLRMARAIQFGHSEDRFETSPIAVDGTLFLTEPPNRVAAIDLRSGHTLWSYAHPLPDRLSLCCGMVNRGVAVLGETVFYGTLDARLVALDAASGRVRWNVEVAPANEGYSITSAPLALRDKVVIGVGGGEFGIRGLLDAYDAESGERLWRFRTIPGPGEPGHDSWSGDSWKTGGAPTWLTGSYDPELNWLFWGVGNPGPNFIGQAREGDNLYSNSVVALDADTGELQWHFQFTPHDLHDWDSNQIPVLLDAAFRGEDRKLLIWANRNAFYYVLDRETGEFLHASAFARQTWAERIDERGRPVRLAGSDPSPEGTLVHPGAAGATNWYSPSYSPATGLFYVPTIERADVFFREQEVPDDWEPGESFQGSVPRRPFTDATVHTFVRALEPGTGALRWQATFPPRPRWAKMGGVLSTAGGLVFVGSNRSFYALDAETGEELWRSETGGRINAAPVSFEIDGVQHVAIAAERALFLYALTAPERARAAAPPGRP